MFMSGPLTTMLAADFGAEVIKVESIQRVDGWRAAGRQGGRPWESSPAYNWVNRSKTGITLNLTDPRGVKLLKQLVSSADVLVENYTPLVMANFGRGDPLAGLMGGVALLAALAHRRRTGEGQLIDLSQAETAAMFVGDSLISAQLTGCDPTRHGNRNLHMAPHGMFPCADDRWIAIACGSDAQWQTLHELMGATTPQWHLLRDRLQNCAQLETAIAAWTSPQAGHELWPMNISTHAVSMLLTTEQRSDRNVTLAPRSASTTRRFGPPHQRHISGNPPAKS